MAHVEDTRHKVRHPPKRGDNQNQAYLEGQVADLGFMGA